MAHMSQIHGLHFRNTDELLACIFTKRTQSPHTKTLPYCLLSKPTIGKVTTHYYNNKTAWVPAVHHTITLCCKRAFSGSHESNDLCQGSLVIMGSEEWIPSTEETEQDHSCCPHVHSWRHSGKAQLDITGSNQ